MRAVFAGPGAWRALRSGDASGRLEVALGVGGYVRLGADDWLLLATPRAVMGPLTLAVAGLGRVRAEAGWPARLDGDALVVGPHRIGLKTCGEPQQPRPHPDVVELLHDCHAEPQRRPVDRDVVEVLHALAGAAPPELAAGATALAEGDLDRAVHLLGGRGDGLTPAGDDILAGYAGLRAHAGAPVKLSHLAADRSPPIALAYLRCAERGELPDPAARFLAAPDARRARVLQRWGSTSGRALMWGFAAAVAAQPPANNGAASASSSASFAPSPI